MARSLVIAPLILVLAGCATQFGAPRDTVDLRIRSEASNRLVWLVRRSDYRRRYEPLQAKPADLQRALVAQRSAVTADGRTIHHASGNYQVIWFCGATAVIRPLQLGRSSAGTSVEFTAGCS